MDSKLYASSLLAGPHSVGDIIGQGFRVFRRNIPLILKYLIVPTSILGVGRIAITLATAYGVKAAKDFDFRWLIGGGIGLIVLFYGAFALYIRQLALVRYFAGIAPNLDEAEKFVSKRIWAMISLFLAIMAITAITIVVWTVPAVFCIPFLKGSGMQSILVAFALAIIFVGLFVNVLYVGMGGAMAYYGLAVDDSDLGTIIARAYSLTFRSFFRTSAFNLLCSTAVALIATPLTAPLMLIIIAYMVVISVTTGNTETTDIPPAMRVLNSTWETIVQMIIGPIANVACGFYFLDLKMRMEGSDLVERLKLLAPPVEASENGS